MKWRKDDKVCDTVNGSQASYTNSIDEAQCITLWQVPDFVQALSAFYYVRVIEIPTPRWTAFDQKAFNVIMDQKVPMTTQERAYTSPIWYTPE